MNRSHEHAGTLLAKARDDAGMMRTLMAAPDSPDWGVGFHAQQAVEKAIKAVLSDRAVEYPRTHNLLLLVELVRSAGLQTPPDETELTRLTPYGAPLRYESGALESEEPLDRSWAKGVVQRVLAWAEGLLGEAGEKP
jgi:HEPN domain-containing protein